MRRLLGLFRNHFFRFQFIKQLRKGVQRTAVAGKARFAALTHVGESFHWAAQVGIGMPP